MAKKSSTSRRSSKSAQRQSSSTRPNGSGKVQRHFCGWTRPLLHSAADWLLDDANQALAAGSDEAMPLFDLANDESDTANADAPGKFDLSGFDIVLPSSRAVARLQELLVQKATERGIAYQPPRFYLVGRLPSLLYRRPAEWASDLEQTLAWSRVLSQAPTERLETLVPTPPDADATAGWLELAGTVRRLLSSLAAENHTFSYVYDLAEEATDKRRWEFLVDAQAQYTSELEKADRCDPNLSALTMITDQRCRALRPIVLVGTTDLTELAKAMISQVDIPVAALIAAPAENSGRFDKLGCLNTGDWKEHELPIQDEQLIAAAAVQDQSHAVTESLASFGQKHSIDEITIGVTDESQVAPIEIECRNLDVSTYRHLGYSVSQTSMGRLLDLILTYRQRRNWRSLAALVRHADVYEYLDRHFAEASQADAANADPSQSKTVRSSKGWITSLDQLLSEAFPRSVDEPLPQKRPGITAPETVKNCVESWLEPLNKKPQRLSQWSTVLAEVIGKLRLPTPDHSATSDPQTAPASTDANRSNQAYLATEKLLGHLQEISTLLDSPVDATTALEMLAGRVAELTLPDTPSPEKIEILGWLDLALDDAPALVVCGLNHPFVPEASSGDPFLPSALQSTINQRNNDRRFARDVHAMHQMLTTRQQTRFIVGTHSADGSPTPPSRLLSAATADDAARRVCRLLTEPRPKQAIQVRSTASTVVTKSAEQFYRPPPPEPGRTIQTLSVTAFSAYLACPYRFYLRHVLRLRPLDDSALELAANQFGDLVHGALERFGESSDKDEPDPDKIADALIEHLHAYAADNYGDNTQATVALQVRQAQRRLKVVAQRQAERVAQGWRIHAVEASVDETKIDPETKQPKEPTGIVLDGEFTGLRGRFDRIDHHPDTGRWAILDYKTHGHHPEKKHLKSNPDGTKRWVDLQLPLYRRFIPDLGIPADPEQVKLGYFNVAEKDTDTKINLASFTEQQFAAADELIHACVRKIRNCEFEPNPSGVEFDDYEMMFNEIGGSFVAPDDNDTETGS
ncbi:PD-(D/E)XK nuclease family protein [Neorhodopirellula lusitana]|uniref:PD-(D/E)XK nuclease family protein n=1 Tax=Neorhodopirellula lusitana TaxID=445327 RepID=UPI00384C706D